ncbi:gamma-butyrobetaine dioxygenase-like isoform X1 [Anastrepha ludens]|uniref:gamma-butyrobetaine dioxygenase-like isoform X1 n=1 Tax=Anastrepha ludens TaxID=28586 RepID=UPI0023AF91EE|nr:gamma-butyrobetaine dioxygenase-like isoform X1 [Anastrepha ludens]
MRTITSCFLRKLLSPMQSFRLQGLSLRHISTTVREHDQMLLIKEHPQQSAKAMQFPGIWLRDNCQCEQCFHRESLSRKPNSWTNFDTKVKVQNVTVDESRQAVNIVWSDRHRSTFSLSWLKERDFSSEARERYMNEWYRPQAKHWGKADFDKILKKFDYWDVMRSGPVLLEWLEALTIHGVAMLKNSPLDVGAVKSLAKRIGFMRKTNYGAEFSIRFRPDAKNYLHMSETLPLHTDLPYYEYKPSITILHTLEQTRSLGGWSTLVDGFNIADQLRVNQPQHFKTLTETSVNWCGIGENAAKAFHNVWRAPVINLDENGKYARINHSVPRRDSHFSIDVDKVAPWYEANAIFVRMAYEQEVTFKTEPGDVLSFNNLRMLHGRTGYDDSEHNIRHILGFFVDWDIVYSKMRVLKRRLHQEEQKT